MRIGPTKAQCDGCGIALTPSQTHYLELRHGWVERRRQGGANAIKLADYTGRVLCSMCLLDAERGEQLGLDL